MRSKVVGLLAAVLVAVAMVAPSQAQEPKPAPAPAGDGRVPVGEYVEIDPEGRANRDFPLIVQQVTPNIIHLRGRNGWVAFASFDAGKAEYRGFFEWPDLPGVGRPGGKWADLYQIRVVVQDGVLRIEGKSAGNEMLIRAKPGGGGPAPGATAPMRPETKQ
jgi:hypothetical protein